MPAIFVSRELLTNLLISTMKKLGQEEPPFAEAADKIQQTVDALM